LEDLAADVEREIGAVNNALNEGLNGIAQETLGETFTKIFAS
jgi:hypothetical protein